MNHRLLRRPNVVFLCILATILALSPIAGAQRTDGRSVEKPTLVADKISYLPGETIDLALFTQDALDQLKGSKSIGSKEELTALGKGLAILGTGDGKKTTFDTPFVRSTELTVFVDGSATSGFNTAYAAGPRGVEQIKFAVAPKSGAVITAKADPAAFDLTTLEVKKPQEKFTK